MFRGIRVLGTMLVVGAMLGGAFAQDGFFGKEESTFQDPSRKRKVEYFSRTTKDAAPTAARPTGAPQVKNYYNQLFGDKNAATEAGARPVIHAEFAEDSGAPQDQKIQPVNTTPHSSNPFAQIETEAEAAPLQTAPAEEFAPELTQPAQPGQFDPSLFDQHPQHQGAAIQSEPVLTTNEPEQASAAPPQKAGDGPQTPMVNIRWAKRGEINVGQPSDCDLIVKNTGSVLAQDVVVDAYFPSSIRLTATEPTPKQTTDHLTWEFGQIPPGEERAIHVSLVPSKRGALDIRANVRFTAAAGETFMVTEPLLKLALQGPKEVVVGEPASQLITVSNPGTGIAQNVVVEAHLPAGLEHARGERLVMEVGSLNPGESRTVRLALLAVSGGNQLLEVEARGDDELRQFARADVFVIAPDLKITADGPGLRYVGRAGNYQLTVTNSGAAVSSNVRVMYRVPDGFDFSEAGQSGQYEAQSRTIKWFVGRLEPGQTTQMDVVLTAKEIGDYIHQVGAISEHGARAEAGIKTTVEGTASLVLEIIDLDDPVEVGTQTGYEIRVHNDGTKSAQKVGISCELPPGVELVGADGPKDHITENGLVVFKSLDQMAPGDTAVYRVIVLGRVEGNHRFRVRLASDSITEPLIFEELTKFYSE